MNGHRRLERILTGYFVGTTLAAVAAVVVALGLVVGLTSVGLDDVSALNDAILKALVVLIGGLWAANRYFVFRTDAPQLRVDPNVDFIPPTSFAPDSQYGLLIYRLDIVNTGKSLIRSFEQYVELSSVTPSDTAESVYKDILRWPDEGYHKGSSIEPGSWSAINAEAPVAKDVRAVRFFLEVRLPSGQIWTWHRTFSVLATPTGQAVSGMS